MMRNNKIGLAMRIGVELCSSLVVGLAMGWSLDYWLDTKPLFIIIFFFLGAASGMLNVFRTAKKVFDNTEE